MINSKLIKITALLFFCCFVSFSAIAQVPAGSLNQNNLYGNDGFMKTVSPSNADIVGSPYFFSEWLDASVETNSNQVFDNLKLKYNIHQNEILLLKPSGDSVALIPNIVNSFTIVNKKAQKVEFRRFSNLVTSDNALKGSFLKVIYEGNTLLLQDAKTKIVRANPMANSGYGVQKKNDEFKREDTYYFINQNLEPIEVKLNKKYLLSALKSKENEIKKFITQEKIDASSEQGWMETMKYYDSL